MKQSTSENSPHPLEKQFLGWQCRLRQHAIRKLDGRPVEGMRPSIKVRISDRQQGPVNTLIVRKEPSQWTDEFRHIVKRTNDPNERFKSAIKLLGSSYYQHPAEFAGFLTASFRAESELAALCLEQKQLQLLFSQYNQTFQLFCDVLVLEDTDPAYQATYWHNSMFNASIPPNIKILRFLPDWESSSAETGSATGG